MFVVVLTVSISGFGGINISVRFKILGNFQVHSANAFTSKYIPGPIISCHH